VTSTAAATALLAGAGAAIATIPDPVGHARHSGPVGTVATDVAGNVDLHAAQARALSNARDIAALERAIRAAQAELARRRAAAGGSSDGNGPAAGGSAQPSWSRSAGTAQAGDDPSSGESTTPPPPSSSASSSTPPPVQATTGASGSTAPTGGDDSHEPGDD
jgi:hypothetical protein